jgi:uncharacterized protein YjgD (DUF1641 family)
MKNNKFEITDIDKFVECSRVLVFDCMGKDQTSRLDDMKYTLSELSEEERNELNEVLSQEEAMSICKLFLRQYDDNKFIVSNKQYTKLIDSLNTRLVSNMLNNLVNRGLLETAFDHESNDFIFWVKENENEEDKKS